MGKKIFKLLLKLLLTGLALFLVFRKIDTEITWKAIKDADFIYLLLALLVFALSKVASAFRLNYFFADLGLRIPHVQNLKLYGIGMFYNLFLPGGIGGDGYKVYLLNRFYKTPAKQLVQAVVLDRINGLFALVFLMLVILLWVDIDILLSIDLAVLAWAGMLGLTIGFFGMMWFLFRRFTGSMGITLGCSLLVQLLQLACAFFILSSLGATAQVMEYQFVFLLSSIVAVLPLTIGGIGARELVFIYSHDYLGIDENVAVAFSLLFFLITALTSLPGVFMKFKGAKFTSFG